MNKRRIKKAIKRLTSLPANKYFFKYMLNKFKNNYLKLVGSTKVAYPSTIMLELTNNCNLACTTCSREYDYGKAMDKGSMELEVCKNVISQLWPYIDSIGLTGMGETFLYKEIEQVVDYIKSKNAGIIISVSTNANFPGFLEKAGGLIGKIDTIQVSIDGVGDMYEKIRRKGSFKSFDSNLKQLVKLCGSPGTDVMLNMVVTKENYSQMADLVEYAESIGVKYIDFTMFNIAAVTNVDSSYYEFYKTEEFLLATKELEAARKRCKNVMVNKKSFTTNGSFRNCPFPWSHFYISWDGYIVPCCAKPFPKEKNFGNVNEANVIDVLNSSSFRDFRGLWYMEKTPGFCNRCHFTDV